MSERQSVKNRKVSLQIKLYIANRIIEGLEDELAVANASCGHQAKSAKSARGWRNYGVISNLLLCLIILLSIFIP